MRFQECIEFVQNHTGAYPDTSPIQVEVADFAVVSREIHDQTLTDCTARKTRPGAAWSNRNVLLRGALDNGSGLARAPWECDPGRLNLVNGCIGRVKLARQIIEPNVTATAFHCFLSTSSHGLSKFTRLDTRRKQERDKHAQSSDSCASAGTVSAKRTPTPMRRTFFSVLENASDKSRRNEGSEGSSPARSAGGRGEKRKIFFSKNAGEGGWGSFFCQGAVKFLLSFFPFF